MGMVLQNGLAGEHREMLDDGSERERRKELQAAEDQDDADQESDEERPWVGNVPAEAVPRVLAASEPAIAMHRHDIGEAAEQHGDAERGVVPGRVARSGRRRPSRCCPPPR